MKRLVITATSKGLSDGVMYQVNSMLLTLRNTVDIDLADTGFFKLSKFEQVEILQEISDVADTKIEFNEKREEAVLKVLVNSTKAKFDENHPLRFEYLRRDVVKALQLLVEKYGGDSKTFRVRLFHIEQDIRKFEQPRPQIKGRALSNSEREQGRPQLIAIDHDDYHAKYIGRTKDGRQFFLTPLFNSAIGGVGGNEFVALFLFDKRGRLCDAQIDEFGSRHSFDNQLIKDCIQKRLSSLGPVSFERIEVAPFLIEKFGTAFGLIAKPPETEDDSWCVELHPGNFMAFYEPWDSGEYDT